VAVLQTYAVGAWIPASAGMTKGDGTMTKKGAGMTRGARV